MLLLLTSPSLELADYSLVLSSDAELKFDLRSSDCSPVLPVFNLLSSESYVPLVYQVQENRQSQRWQVYWPSGRQEQRGRGRSNCQKVNDH